MTLSILAAACLSMAPGPALACTTRMPAGMDERTTAALVPAPRPSEDPPSALEAASRRAVERGLAYLARRQSETLDGSFPRGLGGETREWAPVGVSALGALAFMSAGSSPARGPYSRELQRLIDYLLGLVDRTPDSPLNGYISKQGDSLSRTHGHGFATLVLAQAYGMDGSPNRNAVLGTALDAAVDLIERSQGSEGGWHYSPQVSALHEGSITITYVQALRAARNAGLRVDGSVISRAEDYVQRLQDEEGRFRYQLNDDRSTVGLTAAGITTLNMAGRYDTSLVQNGIDVILRGLAQDPQRTGSGSVFQSRGVPRFRYYERLYLAQAFWQLSDRNVFGQWFDDERERLVRSQHSDGSWRCPEYGDCYGTAINCLVLTLPEGLLPIFQR